MKQHFYRVVSFEVVGPYVLKVDFDDGTSQVIDFRPVLVGELLGPLRDLDQFEQVQIDPETHTLVWPTGVDFHPNTLHDWPEYAGELAKRAREYEDQRNLVVQADEDQIEEDVSSQSKDVRMFTSLVMSIQASGSAQDSATVPPQPIRVSANVSTQAKNSGEFDATKRLSILSLYNNHNFSQVGARGKRL